MVYYLQYHIGTRKEQIMAKFADLEVGQEWAYDRERRADIRMNVPMYATKVTIVSLDKYYKRRKYGEYAVAPKGTTGQYVKVLIGNKNLDYKEDFLLVSQLFMLWSEYEPKRDEANKWREENARRLREQAEFFVINIQPRIDEVAQLMTDLGAITSPWELKSFKVAQIDLLLTLLREEKVTREIE